MSVFWFLFLSHAILRHFASLASAHPIKDQVWGMMWVIFLVHALPSAACRPPPMLLLLICVLSKANPSLDLLQTYSLSAYSSKNSCYDCLLGSDSKLSTFPFLCNYYQVSLALHSFSVRPAYLCYPLLFLGPFLI